MRQLSAKNIVNYVECFLYKSKKEKELWIVMEYLDFGALTDIVIKIFIFYYHIFK
jgi:serine/threonine protein kinase